MPVRHRIGRFLSTLVTIVVIAAGAVACGSAQSAGPLQTQMSGGLPDLAAASIAIEPGQSADGEAYVVNSAADSVQIIQVTAVPVPGEPTAHLIHAAVASTGAGVATARGWPPPVPVRPAVGAQLAHGLSGIIFGITGRAPSREYAIAGVKITYKYHGQVYSTTAWAVEVACVAKNWRKDPIPGCQAVTNKSNGIVEKMIGIT